MNKIYFVNYIQELLYYTRLWTEGGCIIASLHNAVAHPLSLLCALVMLPCCYTGDVVWLCTCHADIALAATPCCHHCPASLSHPCCIVLWLLCRPCHTVFIATWSFPCPPGVIIVVTIVSLMAMGH